MEKFESAKDCASDALRQWLAKVSDPETFYEYSGEEVDCAGVRDERYNVDTVREIAWHEDVSSREKKGAATVTFANGDYFQGTVLKKHN